MFGDFDEMNAMFCFFSIWHKIIQNLIILALCISFVQYRNMNFLSKKTIKNIPSTTCI